MLDVMHNAVCHPQTGITMGIMVNFLGLVHHDLYKFCVKTFYLYRQFSPLDVIRLAPRLAIQLFTGEILELIDEICRQSFFLDSKVRSRKSVYCLLRIVHRLRMTVEKYLVDINYWKNMEELKSDEDN